MLGIDPNVICHKLAINPSIRPIAQKKRYLDTDKRAASLEEIQKLLNAGFIKELRYSTRLANVVMVKKNNDKWRMCVDYTDLSKACPKDAYPLPCIDKLVDNSSGFQCLSFMDAYSGYNQILMHSGDQDKTVFITDNGTTYQRLMDKIFTNQIGWNIEFCLSNRNRKATTPDILRQQIPSECRGPIPEARKTGTGSCNNGQTLWHYFQSHTIVVRTEQPLRQILRKPELTGKLIKWSIELSEYDIQYQSRRAIKSKALADFIAELTLEEPSPTNNKWTLYIDGASNSKGSGAGILLEDEQGTALEQSLQFTFHASNNQAEYEALIAGLRLAHTMGITQLNVKCDSLSVVQQVTGR
ncbi:uncharacterized protein [Arachis hypogaea]|uniref:uncharacterized protein n=1 Tax=Arachis hypogaea TaxID=3818 RepID=UPI003B22574D